MKKILVVEDTPPVGKMIEKRLEISGSYEVTWVKTKAEAISTLDDSRKDFFAALLDFNLPDAPRGEIIAEVVGREIPVIVFTAYVSEEVREKVWHFRVVDYVLKEDVLSLDYILSLLDRLEKNRRVKVLLADGSSRIRRRLKDLLEVHHYQVLTVEKGEEALGLLGDHPEIMVVIAGTRLAEMDGLTLIQKIRRQYSKNRLAIMGVVAEGEHIMAARFLKYGANGIVKSESFLVEEFYCTVKQLIENLEHIQTIREIAHKDFLTGLDNRRSFFLTGEKLYANARRKNISLVCAMFDIDYFKKVNDDYGHEAGDRVLQHISMVLRKRMRASDMVARIGGEEFCVLAVNMDIQAAGPIFDDIRRTIEKSAVPLEDGPGEIKITISGGVTGVLGDNLEQMVKKADSHLYRAKAAGRNRIVTDHV